MMASWADKGQIKTIENLETKFFWNTLRIQWELVRTLSYPMLSH